MGKIIAGMTVSLDGYINDRDGNVDKLFTDFDELHTIPAFQEMIANTGAVIMGKNTYSMADPFMWANDDYEFQVPIFVMTHEAPAEYPQGNGRLSFTFVTDGIESAISQAKTAAGDKDVQVIGANTIQQCLNSGLCNELQLDIMPVLLGGGVRLLENIDTEKLTLERVGVAQTTRSRTSVGYNVVLRS